MRHLDTVKAYFRTIEEDGDASAFFTDDVVQREYPNRFVPEGATRDLAGLREAAVRGRKVIRGQRFDIVRALETGDEVALEVVWTGTLNVAVGKLAEGDAMRAHFGVFLTMRDGRIASQRNYDCFDPF